MKNPATAQDILAYLDAHEIREVKVGVFDVDGIFRGKYIAREKLESALESGFGFCNVVIGWDSADQLYDNVVASGWSTGYRDVEVRLLPETFRVIPFESGRPLLIGEFAGPAEGVCPRGLLRRVLARADGLGFAVSAAAEFEFFLFEETPHSVREKRYRNLRPITPGYFGYSMLRAGVHADVYAELLDVARVMNLEIEGLHTETGPGVIEAALRVDEALAMADKAALFKTVVKILAQRRGWMATFMAKWSRDWPGQSGHLHLSLKDKTTGAGVFHDVEKSGRMSDTMRWFLGGQQRLMPEFLAMVASTINSYTRLIPGFWAPTAASWGIENRTCALRVIPGSEKSQRIEYRVAAADINPYVALAAAVGSGLWGIEQRIEPTAPVEGSAYDQSVLPELQLPRSLMEAAGRLRTSTAARDLFGDAFVDHYAATREWEEREFRKAVTDWEMDRYFEII